MVYSEAAVSTAPWWGVPLIAGIFAILGVSLSQVATWVLDRRRTKRDDARIEREEKRRWHRERQDAYAAYLASATSVQQQLGITWKGRSETLPTLLERLLTCQAAVQLLASDSVAAAAMKVTLTILKGVNTKPDARNDENLEKFVKELLKAQGDFLAQAR